MTCPTTVSIVQTLAKDGAQEYAKMFNKPAMRGPNFTVSSVAGTSIPDLVRTSITNNHPCLATPALLGIAMIAAEQSALDTLLPEVSAV